MCRMWENNWCDIFLRLRAVWASGVLIHPQKHPRVRRKQRWSDVCLASPCVFFKRAFCLLKISVLLSTRLSGCDHLLSSRAFPDQRSLTDNERWRNGQGYYRLTIRQALKQRLHGSECSTLITSVMRKWKPKLQGKKKYSGKGCVGAV